MRRFSRTQGSFSILAAIERDEDEIQFWPAVDLFLERSKCE